MSLREQAANQAETPETNARRRLTWRDRLANVGSLVKAAGRSPRTPILACLVALSIGTFGSSIGQALASTTPASQGDLRQWGTPTPTPYRGYPYPQNQYPTYTPTPFGGYPYPSQNGYPGPGGASVQSGSTQYPSGGSSSGAVVPNPSMSPSGGQPPAGQPGPADPCYGDEQISFSPEEPRVGNELLIAVTSARPHPFGRLAGTEPTQFSRERPGQRGYVWEWLIQPSYPGQHEYTFYVDSTIPCQKIQITVRQQLATATPTATKTPKPYRYN